MRSRLPILDLSQPDAFSKRLPRPSLITSHAAGWKDIYLEFHRLPPFEVPEFKYQQHLITIPTKREIQVEERSDGKRRDLVFRKGSVCIAPKDLSRQYRWEEELEAIQLSLSPELFQGTAYELCKSHLIELISLPLSHDPLIYQLAIALKAELEQSGVESKLYAESAAVFLITHLLQHYTIQRPQRNKPRGGLSQLQIRWVEEYVQDHLADEISLDEISKQLGFSRYYFCRLFKKSVGRSFYQYVIHCRVNRAKQLLRQGKLSLGDVAIACGFSHQSHLHRHFKRITGVTPKQFVNS